MLNPAKAVIVDALPRVGLLPRTPGEQALMDQAPERAQDNKVGAWRYPRLAHKPHRRLYRRARLAHRRGDAATGLPLALELAEAEPAYMPGRVLLELLVGIAANTDAERAVRACVAMGRETLEANERLRRGEIASPRFYGDRPLGAADHDFIEGIVRYNLAERLADLGARADDPSAWEEGVRVLDAAPTGVIDRAGRPDTLFLACARLLLASLHHRLGHGAARDAALAEAAALRPDDVLDLRMKMSGKNPGL